MTREEVLAMEPGRELDALIRQRIFNWNYPSYEQMKSMAEKQWEVQPECIHFMSDFDAWKVDGDFYWEYRSPRYSTDISAAWEVVEKPEIMDRYQIGVYPTSFVKWVARKYMPGGKDCTVQADTAPEAICKCVLLAILESEETP
jgi:hypothetical protein